MNNGPIQSNVLLFRSGSRQLPSVNAHLGRSIVRSVQDPTRRQAILEADSSASSTSSVIELSDEAGTKFDELENLASSSVHAAGQEVLLECVTPVLGLPRANVWLWYKNGQPLDSGSFQVNGNRPDTDNINNNNNINSSQLSTSDNIVGSNNDNPITGFESSKSESGANSSPTLADSNVTSRRRNAQSPSPNSINRIQQHERRPISHNVGARLIHSSRYLFIPSIQLAHKGNYSCVAVNRLGSGYQPQSSSEPTKLPALGSDSYWLNVALAPSFIQPLPAQTYWPEVTPLIDGQENESEDRNKLSLSSPVGHLELVCHVQCDPICQIEWFRNNEPLDLKRQAESFTSNFVSYQVKKTILDENVDANLFKSIESKLIIQFTPESLSNGSSKSSRVLSGVGENSAAHVQVGGSNGRNIIVSDRSARDKILERRRILNEANYTCQSSQNALGAPVRSTTKFIVQYPPENVLINSPSDKLSLIEGSNGPKLTCEASGEPKVQYRWFLLKGVDANSDGSNWKRPSQIISASYGQPRAMQRDSVGSATAHNRAGANDTDRRELDGVLIELVGSTTKHEGGVQVSTLDLSNLSMDRSQSGQYICEASNKLGHARQSLYVNVLYKPACTGLHLFSLDAVETPPMNSPISTVKGSTEVKPFGATSHDEYSVVRDTSEDFINLRRTLVLSPLLNRFSTEPDLSGTNRQELHFKGSIFHQILADRAKNFSSVAFDGPVKENLIDADEKNEIINQDNQHYQSHTLAGVGDSWDKFNDLLIKYLNNYVKQTRAINREYLFNSDGHTDVSLDKQKQSRRSNSEPEESRRTNKGLESGENVPTANLLTFACLAQDGNPIGNLSFAWMFGSSTLPEASESIVAKDSLMAHKSFPGNQSPKPTLLYSNANSTLHVVLVRRIDTKQSLNPFQMSLITVNVVVEPSSAWGQNLGEIHELRQASPTTNMTQTLNRAPVIKNRFQAPKPTIDSRRTLDNIQFASDFIMKPYSLNPSVGSFPVELNEHNWQEQIGKLLKCSITNQIGSSEVCPARVNILERSKTRTAKLSEYAKWKMPSLSNKSLLIISILIGCTMIVFATSILLNGPYLKVMQFKKDNNEGGSEGTNTGQSTSSQKSSVLGLLGTGDSSLQTSSDDDSSARLNHREMANRTFNGTHVVNHHSMGNNQSMQMNRDTKLYNHNIEHQHSHLHPDVTTNYDRPRSMMQSTSRTYENGLINESSSDGLPDQGSTDYRRYACEQSMSTPNQNPFNPKDSFTSVGSRLLANLGLKSFSKFKVDRISDLSNFSSRLEQIRNLHTKTESNSETNTTGLSGSGMDGDLSLKYTSPAPSNSPVFFPGPTEFRRSYTECKRPEYSSHTINRASTAGNYLPPNVGKIQQSDLNYQWPNQRPKSFLSATSTRPSLPTYSNLVGCGSYQTDAMEEFIRRRDPDYNLKSQLAHNSSFYRSQSVKGQSYLPNNDLNRYYPNPMKVGPPVYPRSHHISTIYKPPLIDDLVPPALFAKTEQSHPSYEDYLYNQPMINQPPMRNYNPPIRGLGQIVMPSENYSASIVGHSQIVDFPPITVSSSDHQSQHVQFNTSTATTTTLTQPMGIIHNQTQDDPVEHIYDVNAYATPDQTPLRTAPLRNQISQLSQEPESERPRVSQLIQTFNSKLPNDEDES